ncbi:aminoacyl-tRNA hydrolase [Patescibacteria group bacterium]|nr:aminoacyl-tRNA hydrolase [Patescibacteria group bacterium]
MSIFYYNKGMYFKAVLGLGNPGSKYKNTYHNVGHLMTDFLVKNNILSANINIAKNSGCMNESGSTAVKLLKKFKIKSEKLLIIHDDSDIAMGKYKISFDRNSAGHKGVEDIFDRIGTKKNWRLRIGIRPLNQRLRAKKFVLKKIKKEDIEIFKKVFEEASFKIIENVNSPC